MILVRMQYSLNKDHRHHSQDYQDAQDKQQTQYPLTPQRYLPIKDFCRGHGKIPDTKATEKPDAETISSWSYDMEGHAKKMCGKILRNGELKRLNNYTKSRRHAWMTIKVKKKKMSKWENYLQSAHIVLKCLYLARIGRPDILWSVNKVALAVTKWTKSCDRRLARLISCIHHTSQ